MTTRKNGSGYVKKDDLEGPLAGKEISDLMKVTNFGSVYAEIYDEDSPDGAIRCQLAVGP